MFLLIHITTSVSHADGALLLFFSKIFQYLIKPQIHATAQGVGSTILLCL